MPVLASARFHNPGFGGLADQAFAHDFDFEHQRLDVARQHNVAAAAQNEFGRALKRWVGQQCINIGLAFQTNQR